MELLSGVADVVGLLQVARGALGRNHGFDVEFRACVERALREALLAQNAPVEAPVATLLAPLGAVGATSEFLPDVFMIAADDAPGRWAIILRDFVKKSTVLDTSEIDVDRLADRFGARLASEVRSSAAQPSSPFFSAYVVSHLQGHAVQPAIAPAPSGGISNIWSLPLTVAPVERPETAVIERLLQDGGMAVIAGGPGAGKSVIARVLAHRRLEGDASRLVWWIAASSHEQFTAACESLLREAGATPTSDPRSQVRSMLANRNDWFLVIDDALDLADVSSIVPAGVRTGQVLVTTKANTFPADEVVRLSAADDDVLTRIARSILPAATSDDAIDELVVLCQGNPLAIATCSHFIASTGADIDEVSALLQTAPSAVLSTEIGPGYPSSFNDIVRRALAGAEDHAGLASALMAVMAMCGGADVLRVIVRTSLAADTLVDFTAAVRALRDSGLIDFDTEALRCHALVAAIARDALGEDMLQVAGERVLTAVGSLCTPSADFDPLALATVVDLVDAHGLVPLEAVAVARIALIDALDRNGLIASARRQAETLRMIPDAELSPVSDAVFTLIEARLLLTSGEADSALPVARQGIAKLDRLGGDYELDLRSEFAELRASFHVVEMWAATQLGFWDDARIAWSRAQEASPDDEDLRQLGAHLTLVDSSPARRASAFAGLAAATGSDSALAGYYYGMASRAATDGGLADPAVDYAQRAIAADVAAFGERSSSVARDRSDLGMALVEAGRLDEAEQVLNSALEFYQRETAHPNAAIPRLHLGRVLSARARTARGSRADRLWAEARSVLQSATTDHAKHAPRSAEQAGLLYALAETYQRDDPARAVVLLTEALSIDREIYGDLTADVGHDVARLMEAYLGAGDASAALEAFAIVKSSVPEWELSNVLVAGSLLIAQLRCLLALPLSPLRRGEIATVSRRLENLLHRHDNLASVAPGVRNIIGQARRAIAG